MKQRRFIMSFQHAFEGIFHVFRYESNMKIHFLIAVLVGILAVACRVDRTEMILLIITIALVFLAEIINTAIERVVDLITQQYHPLAKIAKNVAAGAVLVTAINALAVGYLIFFDRLSKISVIAIQAIDQMPIYLTLLALILVLAVVIVVKSVYGRGSYLRGGMPSGHCAVAFSLFAAITMISGDAILSAMGAILALLVAHSRVETHVHTLYEAIAGGTVGVLVTIICFQLFRLWA